MNLPQVDAQTALAEIIALTKTSIDRNKIGGDKIALPNNTIGTLDFSVLTVAGLNNIREIIIPDNEITSITNLPESLENLHIGKNSLTNPPKLPSRLKTLYIGTTPLTQFDLGESLQLNSVCIIRPPNDHNINITQIPPGLVRISRTDQPHTHQFELASKSADNRTIGTTSKLTVTQALGEYFRMKSEYERRNLAEKHKLYKSSTSQFRKWEPKCINCRNVGGTLFTHSRGEYTATCGHMMKPCPLDLRIAAGSFADAAAIMASASTEAEDIKTKIIRQRMDAVFGYISEATAATEFEKVYAEYIAATQRLADTRLNIGVVSKDSSFNRADELDRDVAELTMHIRDMIARYNATGDRAAMIEAVRIQMQDLAPAAKLAVKSRFVDIEMVNSRDNMTETLMRHEVSLETRAINIGADQTILSWTL